MSSYYSKTAAESLQALQSADAGLSAEEARKRLEQHGRNELKEKKKSGALLLFIKQFRDFMILILCAAALLSGLMGDVVETLIILLIVLLNAVVGFIQEYRAEKAMEALKKLSTAQSRVIRDGMSHLTDAATLVPGDVVLLEAGNLVPADLRLLECHALRIDESSLTGESVPIDKSSHVIPAGEPGIADQFNMAFKGTLVINGRAKGLVVATGMQTELGKIADLLQQKESTSPLQRRMSAFSKNLSYVILLICVVLFVSGYLRGEEPIGLLLLSVSLAVAAIPEALPALITYALARGASLLAKKRALIRKLPAVETLGSVSFICSDKTGTLTLNQMRVMREHDQQTASLHGNYSLLHLSLILNHDLEWQAESGLTGDSTELGLLNHVLKSKSLTAEEQMNIRSLYPRVGEIPFDSDRKCMSTIHRYGDAYLMVTKGAGERIAAILKNRGDSEWLLAQSNQWASEGLRVLGFSYKRLETLPQNAFENSLESDMEFSGLIAMADPPRPEAMESIRLCKTAGIHPVMITGDHPATARFIAREIGILDEQGLALSGKELSAIDETDFSSRVEKVSVYARVTPEQKLRIVRTLQSKGHFVAMTGDGVNDAPSLKAANIGVAMGINGTDVSREAAHMILLDDNFSTIVSAVYEGRRIYDNIRKFVKYIMTCNSAEIWTLFLAPLLGMPMPLLPIHILWINLVTDGLPALALVNEKSEPDLMQRPPRPANESLFAGGMGHYILWVGLLMAGITLGTQAWALNQGLEHWQTMVFTVLAMLQLGQVLAIRSERSFIYRQGFFSNPSLLWSVLFTAMLQLMVIYLPVMNGWFQTQALSLAELGYCAAAVVVFFHLLEFEKWLRLRVGRKRH